MGGVHLLASGGDPGSLESSVAEYLSADARPHRLKGGGVAHRLLPSEGDGAMTTFRLRDGFTVTRYDVEFREPHQVEYDLPADHFEVECCIAGELHVHDRRAGRAVFVRERWR